MNDPYIRENTREGRKKRRYQENFSDALPTPAPTLRSQRTYETTRYHVQFFSDAVRDNIKRIAQSFAILVAITLLILMTVAT